MLSSLDDIILVGIKKNYKSYKNVDNVIISS